MVLETEKHASAARRLVGQEPAIPASGRRKAPDRREVSLRWLSGTFLTGVTSAILMGVALFAGLDGKSFLATPPEVLSQANTTIPIASDDAKADRITLPEVTANNANQERRRMSVSTISRVGDTNVVRTKPFEQLSITLAAMPAVNKQYPAFNPLKIFADPDQVIEQNEAPETLIYGADVETEASIRIIDFVFNEAMKQSSLVLSDEEAEQIVSETAPILTDGSVEVAALHYVDPARFSASDPAMMAIDLRPIAKIIPQNVSVAEQDENLDDSFSFYEDLVETSDTTNINALLTKTKYGQAEPMAEALSTLLRTDELKSGQIIRLGIQSKEADKNIVRASVYSGRDHLLTIALNDKNQYVPAQEPIDFGIMSKHQSAAEDEVKPAQIARDLPDAYDAIYRGVLGYGLPITIADQIVRMVAADVNFKSTIKPDDRLELFYSVPEEANTNNSVEELLFVEATFNGQTRTFYRFRSNDGTVDYFDADGRSAKQFLIRTPVPNARFADAYGMRRHPILGIMRMHWGVDWAAPRGTPIIAPGNGIVESAGWAGGSGKRTIIKHANGYETYYLHQSKFGKGIVPGARVRQGQVIGYIGTTGLSTGPHLHYEVHVNGKHVDPMRVRLPQGKTLKGEELTAFNLERDRINNLLKKTASEGEEVAQASG